MGNGQGFDGKMSNLNALPTQIAERSKLVCKKILLLSKFIVKTTD